MKKKFTFRIILVASIFAIVISCRKNEIVQTTLIPPISTPVNAPPVAKAGPDQTITLPVSSVVLDGSNSFDVNDNILSYRWTEISGISTLNISNDTSRITTVHFIDAGTYYFELTVKDSLHATSRDTCRIDVLPGLTVLQSNMFLSVDILEYDSILNLPANSVTFNATTYLMNGTGSVFADPVVKKIEWKKIAGPANFSIQSPDKLTTTINNLTQGMYAFECNIIDTAGRIASSITVVRVIDPAAAEQELLIQNVKWDEGNGFWNPTTELNLNSVISVNKSVKKVLVKTACDTNYIEALPLWLWQGSHPHFYFMHYTNNQFRITIDNWSECPNGTVNIKIIYS